MEPPKKQDSLNNKDDKKVPLISETPHIKALPPDHKAASPTPPSTSRPLRRGPSKVFDFRRMSLSKVSPEYT